MALAGESANENGLAQAVNQ